MSLSPKYFTSQLKCLKKFFSSDSNQNLKLYTHLFEKSASELAKADALLVTGGSGIGVDSGLPDFRGNEGFWKAYPPFAKLGYRFHEMANPSWFWKDKEIAW